MDSWPAEHWLGLNWTLGRCTLQIEARYLWNLLEVKNFPDGGLCIYHKSSVSSRNKILLGVRVAQEAGLEVQSQQIRFLLKTLLLACLRLSSQMGTEERELWFVTPPSNCRTLESGNYLIFFTASGEKGHCFEDYLVIVAITTIRGDWLCPFHDILFVLPRDSFSSCYLKKKTSFFLH